MTFIDDAGKEVFTDEDLEMLEKSGYDTWKMTDEELNNAYNKEKAIAEDLSHIEVKEVYYG